MKLRSAGLLGERSGAKAKGRRLALREAIKACRNRKVSISCPEAVPHPYLEGNMNQAKGRVKNGSAFFMFISFDNPQPSKYPTVENKVLCATSPLSRKILPERVIFVPQEMNKRSKNYSLSLQIQKIEIHR